MKITINNPCSEDWDKMTPTEKGAFCQKCALEVHDFSQKTPLEIQSILINAQSSRICGRISKETLKELNPAFHSWSLNSKRSLQSRLVFSLLVVFGFTLFSCSEDEKERLGELQLVGQTFIQVSGIQELKSEAQIDPKPTNAERIVEMTEVLPLPPVQVIQDRAIETEYIKGQMYIEPIEPKELTLGRMEYTTEHIDSISEAQAEIPPMISTKLYPNPAINTTNVTWEMPVANTVQLRLFNLAGELVSEVFTGQLDAGEHEMEIDLSGLNEGIYLLYIQSQSFKTSIKLRKF